MTPPPPPKTFDVAAAIGLEQVQHVPKNSTWPPWWRADRDALDILLQSGIDDFLPTERLCPRWITSAPVAWMMRRMMLIDASCPSNSDAAVTKRSLFFGLWGGFWQRKDRSWRLPH